MGRVADDTSLEQMGDHQWKARLQRAGVLGGGGGYVLGIVGHYFEIAEQRRPSRLTPFIWSLPPR